MSKKNTLLDRRLEIRKGGSTADLDPIKNVTADGTNIIVEPKQDNTKPMNEDILEQVNDGTAMYNDVPGAYSMSVPAKKIEYIQDSSLGVNSKGSAFPMVNPEKPPLPMMPGQMPAPQPLANRAGAAVDRNVLTNDPNIDQPVGKVPYSSQQRNELMGSIASNPGELYNKPAVPQQKTFQPNQGMAMYDGPEFNDGLREASKAGKLDDNPNFKAAVDKAPGMYDGPANYSKNDAMVDQCMAPGMYDGPAAYSMNVPANKIKYIEGFSKSPIGLHEKHTQISKANVNSAMKDDAAHASYLKRDIKYDAKHGGSNKQMTRDEKHISKLYGDMKYDFKKKKKYDNV